jgi:hypothetical protein
MVTEFIVGKSYKFISTKDEANKYGGSSGHPEKAKIFDGSAHRINSLGFITSDGAIKVMFHGQHTQYWTYHPKHFILISDKLPEETWKECIERTKAL